MITIASSKNETYRKLLSLTGSRGLKREGLFLLSGEKLICEFLNNPSLDIVYEVIAPHMTPHPAIEHHKEFETLQLTQDLFDELDVLGTHCTILVLQQPALPVLDQDQIAAYQPQGIEVVVPIGDPGNLGALLRSCEAFGVPRVLLTEEAAHPFLPKAVKASAGSVLRLPMAHAPALRAFPRHCIALDMEGLSIDDFVWPSTGLLVVGEEGPGLSTEGDYVPFAQHIRIPTQGVESLNVVVAASIALARCASSRKA